jgi:hypothetical protein
MDKQYTVVWAEYNRDESKDALYCDMFPGKYNSLAAARRAVFREIESCLSEDEDLQTDEQLEEAVRACVWRGYESGNCICEEHGGVETIYRIKEVAA